MHVNAFEALPGVCKRFNKKGVKYVLIGGCAINLHGFIRPTRDIDFVIKLGDENIERIREALQDLVPEIEELTVDMMQRYGEHGVIRIGTAENFYIDLTTKIGELDYQKLKRNELITTIDEVKIYYAGLDDMIELKSGYREADQRDRLFLLGKKQFLNQKRRSKKD